MFRQAHVEKFSSLDKSVSPCRSLFPNPLPPDNAKVCGGQVLLALDNLQRPGVAQQSPRDDLVAAPEVAMLLPHEGGGCSGGSGTCHMEQS